MKSIQKFSLALILVIGLPFASLSCAGPGGGGSVVVYGGHPWFGDGHWVDGGGRAWYGAHGSAAYVHPAGNSHR